MKIDSEEKRLIIEAREGDMRSMEKLYKINVDSLFRFVYYKVNLREIAEDIVSESFTRAFESLKRFKFKSSFKTYVYTIAKNLVYDWYKKKAGGEINFDDIELLPDKSNDNRGSINIEAEKEVRDVLKKLPEKYAKVLEHRFLFKFSVKETAETLELSEANVKVIQMRALRKARELVASS